VEVIKMKCLKKINCLFLSVAMVVGMCSSEAIVGAVEPDPVSGTDVGALVSSVITVLSLLANINGTKH
jgi:hypothetical protein